MTAVRYEIQPIAPQNYYRGEMNAHLRISIDRSGQL